MQAAVLRRGELVVAEIGEPRPASGQVLVRSIACGVCGSDFHFASEPERAAELLARARVPAFQGLTAERDIHLGHEFVAEVLELGPDTEGPRPGTVLTSLPALLTPAGPRVIGYSNNSHGGYAEQFLMSAPLALPVPNGMEPIVATLAEPFAVARHAVTRVSPAQDDVSVVVGCGTIGLAVIADLRRRGVEQVIAIEPSRLRQAIALDMGATTAIDPAFTTISDALSEHDASEPPVVFEAVGARGVLRDIVNDVPRGTQIVTIGAGILADTLDPLIAACKEITMHFSFSSTPQEFAETLHSLGDGEIDVAPLAMKPVTLAELPAVFAKTQAPDEGVKLFVDYRHDRDRASTNSG